MKKIAFFLPLLLFVLSFYTPTLVASVPAQTFLSNDITTSTSVLCSPCPCPPGLPTWLPIANTIFQILSTILLAILTFLMFLLLFGSNFNIFGSCIRRFHKKPHGSIKPENHNIEKGYHKKKHDNYLKKSGMGLDKKEDKDYSYKQNMESNKKANMDYHGTNQYNYCNKKYDPRKGYSLDCHNKNPFPYNNNYNKYL